MFCSIPFTLVTVSAPIWNILFVTLSATLTDVSLLGLLKKLRNASGRDEGDELLPHHYIELTEGLLSFFLPLKSLKFAFAVSFTKYCIVFLQ